MKHKDNKLPKESAEVKLPTICKSSFEGFEDEVLPVTQNDSWHVMGHVGMSQSACHTERSYVTCATPKSDHFWSTHQRHGHSFLIAEGCGRLRTQKQRRANTSPPPHPQSKKRTLRDAFGKRENMRKQFDTYFTTVVEGINCGITQFWDILSGRARSLGVMWPIPCPS